MASDSDSETNDQHTFAINKHIENAFAKLKEKYGSDDAESDSSDTDDSEDSADTEEDSDGEELTPAVDAAILRTLARIRKKDPAIYEGGRRVFEEEHTRTQDKAPATKPKTKTKEKSKPFTIREAALASALAEADSDSCSQSPEPRLLAHTEEQALLRSETRAAFHGIIDSDAEGDDDLLIPRSRTRDEIELEEEDYKAFLEREVGEDLHNLVALDTNELVGTSEGTEIVGDGDNDNIREGKRKKKGKQEREKARERSQEKDEVQGKKSTKERDKQSKEEFLMNYIFNRGWVDQSNRRAPTYHEIVESSKASKRRSAKSQVDPDHNSDDEQGMPRDVMQSDEDSFDDLADAFETSYNFRFEEPGGAAIPSFPRNLLSARRESTSRKDARVRKKERQRTEKQVLLDARRGEIRKARELVEATIAEDYPGNDHASVIEKDTCDNKSKNQINIDDVVLHTNTKTRAEVKKQKKKEKKRNKKADEDVGVDVDEMDADLDADLDAGANWDDWDDDDVEWRGTEEDRKRKVDAYMDEVVNRLGFSGITSHMPTRFHYISTAPENYSLSPAEILLATDAELNSYVGLTKMAPYRVDKGGKAKKNWDPKRMQRLNEFRESLHSRVGSHYDGSWSLDVGANSKSRATEAQGEKKKRKGKKERAKLKASHGEDDGDNAGAQPEAARKSEKRKRDPDVSSHSHVPPPGGAERHVEDGAQRKKRRRRHKKGSGGTDAVVVS